MIHRSLFALSFCALALVAQPSPDLDARLTGAIQAAVNESGVPSVSVAVVLDGKLAYARAIGYAGLSPRRAADVGTRYAIGSISKQFTAAALLLLQEAGQAFARRQSGEVLPGAYAGPARSPCGNCSRTPPATKITRRRTTSFPSGRSPSRRAGSSTHGPGSPSISTPARTGSTATRTTCWRLPYSRRSPAGRCWSS